MTITKRLARTNYNRPQQTYQETLNQQDIKDKLKDYKRVTDISKLTISTHLRYFTKDKNTGNLLFRLGGNLNKIDQQLRYVILNNGNVSWSVQVKDTIFYQKMSDHELRDEIKRELTEEQPLNDNSEYKKQIRLLNSKIQKYEQIENDYKNLENDYKNLENNFKKILEKNKDLESQINKIKDEIKKAKQKEQFKKKNINNK